MKRLVWIDTNSVRAFGCAGCRWTYPVKEFTPEFSDTEVREDFLDHDCDNPRFRFENGRSSTPPGTADSTPASVSSDEILRDLCGLKGAVLAGIEASLAAKPSHADLAAIKAELDSARSLLWLHMHASPMPSYYGPQVPSKSDQRRRWRRYDFHVPVTLTMSQGNRKIHACGTDLNEGGMTVHSEAEIALGDALKVEFRPPFSITAVNLAVVVRNRIGTRYGLEFIGSNGEEFEEIVLLRKIMKLLEARVSYYEERETKETVD